MPDKEYEHLQHLPKRMAICRCEVAVIAMCFSAFPCGNPWDKIELDHARKRLAGREVFVEHLMFQAHG